MNIAVSHAQPLRFATSIVAAGRLLLPSLESGRSVDATALRAAMEDALSVLRRQRSHVRIVSGAPIAFS